MNKCHSYKCDLCPSEFSEFDNWVRHQVVHQEKRAICPVCQREFQTPESLAKHRKTYSGSCPVCNRDFSNCKRRKFHKCQPLEKRLDHDKKPRICKTCNLLFLTARAFSRHKRLHEPKYKCDDCQAEYTKLVALRKHVLIQHLGEKLFKCSTCQKIITTAANLKKHLRIHESDPELYSCRFCSKQFLHYRSFISHEKVHRKQNIFTCEICKLSFNTQAELVKHVKAVHDKKTFKCSFCGEEFPKVVYLKIHEKIHDNELRMYTCNDCLRIFSSPASFKYHLKTHIKERARNVNNKFTNYEVNNKIQSSEK